MKDEVDQRIYAACRAARATEHCILEVDSPCYPAGWDEYLQCGCHRCLEYIRRYILELEKPQPARASERVFDQIEGARNCIKKGFYAQADLILSDILSLPAARARSEIRRAVDDQGRPIGHTAARASEQE